MSKSTYLLEFYEAVFRIHGQLKPAVDTCVSEKRAQVHGRELDSVTTLSEHLYIIHGSLVIAEKRLLIKVHSEVEQLQGPSAHRYPCGVCADEKGRKQC